MSAKWLSLFTIPIFDSPGRPVVAGFGNKPSRFGILTFGKVFSLSSAFLSTIPFIKRTRNRRGSLMRSIDSKKSIVQKEPILDLKRISKLDLGLRLQL